MRKILFILLVFPSVAGAETRSRRFQHAPDRQAIQVENRDAKSYRWRLQCQDAKLSGLIKADGVIRFKPRGTPWRDCSLSLETAKRVKIVAGARLIIRRGRLVTLQVSTVLFPPVAVYGDTSLSSSAKYMRQWAIRALASSEYGSNSWSAMQATGPANVETCSDNAKAWATKPPNGGREWLSLVFPKKVRAIGALIHVSYNPGAIVEIQAKTGGGWVRIWRGKDVSSGHCPSVLAVRFQEPVDTDSIRIILDTRLVSGWNEIDAVQLVSLKGRTK